MRIKEPKIPLFVGSIHPGVASSTWRNKSCFEGRRDFTRKLRTSSEHFVLPSQGFIECRKKSNQNAATDFSIGMY